MEQSAHDEAIAEQRRRYEREIAPLIAERDALRAAAERVVAAEALLRSANPATPMSTRAQHGAAMADAVDKLRAYLATKESTDGK